jgi:hypothetical protein
MTQVSEANEYFSAVRGTIFCSLIGGAGTGSTIALGFGEQVPARRWLKNQSLSTKDRTSEPERSLLIYCDWRLEKGGQILSTSQSIYEESIDLRILEAAKGTRVKDIRFVSAAHDLCLDFEDDLSLVVFCDLPSDGGDEGDANFVMFDSTSTIAVDVRGELVIESR